MDTRKKLLALIVLETIVIVVCLMLLAPSANRQTPTAAPAAFVPATALAERAKAALQAGDFAAFAALHDWDAIVRANMPEAERAALTPEQVQAKAEEMRAAFAAGVFTPLAAKAKTAPQFAVVPPPEAAVQDGRGKLEISISYVTETGEAKTSATYCELRYAPGQEPPWRIVSLLNPL